MKRLLRHAFLGFLAIFARAVIRKYHPTVVMVTGSVGKTSTKDAIRCALSKSAYVRAPEKSYNSEFGVPFTILGSKNPWTNPIGWIRVFTEAIALWLLPSVYPKILILEVGADRPGDIKRILRIVTPDVVVLTKLPDMPVHVEAYATPDAVREEEFQPAYALAPGAPLVFSADDKYAHTLAAPLSVKVLSFGQAKQADVRVGSPELIIENARPVGMKARVEVVGESHELRILGAVGTPQLLAPAAALATAVALDMKIENALAGLEGYEPPPGRCRLLRGKDGSILIDDSYNSSPAAVEEALASLTLIKEKIPGTRRVAVLGDMLELGRYSQEEHERIGRLAAKCTDILVTIGPRAHAVADAARAEGMGEDKVRSFETSKDAAHQIASMVAAGDAVLVKGSQSIRTERIVEALLADSADLKYLVRQDPQWKKR
jgi:UDP-N-acetylmuramoyl-tripeptide--D-alanyl-D-alanine ligase